MMCKLSLLRFFTSPLSIHILSLVTTSAKIQIRNLNPMQSRSPRRRQNQKRQWTTVLMIKMLQQEIFHPMLPWLWFCMKVIYVAIFQLPIFQSTPSSLAHL